MPYVFDPESKLMVERKPEPVAQAPLAGMTGGGYRAAEFSTMRNELLGVQTSLNPGRDIDSYTLSRLRGLSDHFHRNSGFTKRLFNAAARYSIGRGIVPTANSDDKKWNDEADEYFGDWARRRQVFDVAGRHNFYSSQRYMSRGMFRLGEMFAVRSESLDTEWPMMQFFEGTRVGGAEKSDRWQNGKLPNKRGRVSHYRFLKPGSSSDREKIVDARKVSHLYDPERGDQYTGRPWLSFGLHRLGDKDEIESAATMGVKLDQILGLVVTKKKDGAKVPFGAATTVDTGENEDGEERPGVTMQSIFSTGAITYLNQDESIESFQSDKPSERMVEWCFQMVRDLCWGFGISPELAWNLSGVGGAPMRWILQDGQLFFEELQELLRMRYVEEVWRYRIGWGVATGELRVPNGGRAWYHPPSVITPQKVTVDVGRDGKLQISLVQNAMLSLPRYYRALGLDWREEIGAQMDALKWIKNESNRRGIDAKEVLAALPNVGTAAFDSASSASGSASESSASASSISS